jgi:hypothetical protein
MLARRIFFAMRKKSLANEKIQDGDLVLSIHDARAHLHDYGAGRQTFHTHKGYLKLTN